MNKAIYKSLILLVGAMLMACQGGKGNAPSKEAEPKETVKQTEKVRNISWLMPLKKPIRLSLYKKSL